MTASRPWMKFYPQDWRADERLRNCSLGARGLWVEMLSLMHRSERYGYLLINGRAPTDRQLAVQVGATTDEIAEMLLELETEAVFSRETDGTIFSRRMVRDEEKHDKLSRMGKKGVRAKRLKDKEETPTLKPTLKPRDKGALHPRGQRPERNLSVSRARNIPEDWKPEPFGEGTEAAAIVGGWSAEHLQSQVERFADHHRAKGSKFADWQAAWGTWVRNSVKFGQARFSSGGSDDRYSFIDQAARDVEQRKRALTTHGAG